jgi:hypothetical protein
MINSLQGVYSLQRREYAATKAFAGRGAGIAGEATERSKEQA